MNKIFFFFFLLFFCTSDIGVQAQTTQIKGFVDVGCSYGQNKGSFSFGEQDLFINSVINDRISFLGETIFKYTPSTPTEFSVSIERIIINYNLQGNNNLILGKVHTPVNYWNDTYHHGRVFFPTIERPLLFSNNIIPLHTVGLGFQGHDFGKLKFGYDVFIGNGLGSTQNMDNDISKSVTIAAHVKPFGKLKIGASWYRDVIAKGAMVHDMQSDWKINQNLATLYISNFGKKIELLAEGTYGLNHTDTTGTKSTLASYVYFGYKMSDKIVPYVRFDNIKYEEGEMYYHKNNISSFVAGMRYQINYLAVVKLEYQYQESEMLNSSNKVIAQFAIGF